MCVACTVNNKDKLHHQLLQFPLSALTVNWNSWLGLCLLHIGSEYWCFSQIKTQINKLLYLTVPTKQKKEKFCWEMRLGYFGPPCTSLDAGGATDRVLISSSAEQSNVLTRTLVVAWLEQTACTAALESLTTLSELHPCVGDAHITVASTPRRASSATIIHQHHKYKHIKHTVK